MHTSRDRKDAVGCQPLPHGRRSFSPTSESTNLPDSLFVPFWRADCHCQFVKREIGLANCPRKLWATSLYAPLVRSEMAERPGGTACGPVVLPSSLRAG